MHIIKKAWLYTTVLISILFSVSTVTADTGNTRSSKSVSYITGTEPDNATKDLLFGQLNNEIMDRFVVQGVRMESTVMAAHMVTDSTYNHGDISIYDASTELISDFNYDGFYHRFSVEIDVDTVFHTSYVYVMLYLSYEGGPWNHYASSDSYHIHGDSELDSIIIETQLADGYPAGYYDVRIEVYDADHNEWLLSYGPYDDASLNTLPLQDSFDDNDTYYYPVESRLVITGHGHGSMGWWILLAPVVLLFRLLPTSHNTRKKTINTVEHS